MPLPFPLLLPSPSLSLSLLLPFPFSFPWRRRRHHCPCCCRWLLVASSNFRIYILLLVGLVVAVTNCWMTAVAISASTFALCNLKAALIDYFLFYLYDSVWNCHSLVRSRVFHPAKEEIIFHIVCSRTKEYQSYGSNDPIFPNLQARDPAMLHQEFAQVLQKWLNVFCFKHRPTAYPKHTIACIK